MRSAPLALLLIAITPAPALATYSAPLTRVRIDRDRASHTPSILYAIDDKSRRLGLRAIAGQYVGQIEYAEGYGAQLTLALGFGELYRGRPTIEPLGLVPPTGFLAGGQLRLYAMLWSGGGADDRHPHAVTAFVNGRVTYYGLSAEWPGGTAEYFSFSVVGEAGLMMELAILPWLSLCPFASFTPTFVDNFDLPDRIERRGPSFRQPLLFGADLWIYPLPSTWEGHFSLTFLASLLDTTDEGGRIISGVLGYTF
jgi:hypothetical protein